MANAYQTVAYQLTEAQLSERAVLADKFNELAGRIGRLPDGRVRSVALTQLETAYLWAAEACK